MIVDNLTSLHTLQAAAVPKIENYDWKALNKLPNLTHLDMSCNSIDFYNFDTMLTVRFLNPPG